jgi:glycosyltransferase involved in cell wall biosynthesis
MKVLQVTNRFYPSLGGVETHVLEVSKRLVLKGHKVTVISSDFKESKNSERYVLGDIKGSIDGVTYIKLWSVRLFGIDATTTPILLFFWLLLNVHKFDIVHAHTYGYTVGWMPVLIAKMRGVKTVFTPHYSDGAGISKNIKYVYDLCIGCWQFKISDMVIALTKTEKREIEEYTKRNNVVVIPNGITPLTADVQYHSKNELFEKFDINKTHINFTLIFSIGRLDKRKGYIYLLESMKSLQDTNIICVIYGSDWGEYENLIQYRNTHKLNKVYIIQEMSQFEKNSFLSNCDLFVLPSLQEAFGIVYLEAMQHGIPVIGTDAGAIKDVILSECGSLAKVANSVDLTSKIEYELSIKRDKNQLIKYANTFDWNDVVDKIIHNAYENKI